MLRSTTTTTRMLMNRIGKNTSTALVGTRNAGGGGAQFQPPFVQRARDKRQMHEHDELIWDDGVAPETCIDFDAPHVTSGTALLWLSGGLAFFGGLGYMISRTDPAAKNPAAPRELPFDGLKNALGEGDNE